MNIASHRGFEVGAAARRTAFLRFAIAALAAATDAAAIVLISIGTGILYHKVLYGDVGPIPLFLQSGLVTAWLYVVVNAYRLEYSVLSYLEFKRYPEKIVRNWTITFIGLIVLSFLTKTIDAHSRGWLILFYLSGLLSLTLIHALFVRAVAAGNEVGLIATKRLFLVGAETAIVDFVRRYKVREIGLEIAGTANLRRPDGTPEGEAHFANELRDAVRSARALDLDGVFVVLPWHDRATIDRCVEAFMTVPTSIYLAPERLLDRFESIAIEQIGPVASLHLLRPPLSMSAVLVKRFFDIVLASAGLVVLSPLLLLVALLIKLDSPGPVFFLQRRYGFNQNPFRILKFRTMTTLDDGPVVASGDATRRPDHPARAVPAALEHRRAAAAHQRAVGRHVAGGAASPRARPRRDWGKSIALYARRHNVKPGITGWAQIHGFRGNIGNDDQLLNRYRIRLVLHRQLVDLARLAYLVRDGVPSESLRERLLDSLGDCDRHRRFYRPCLIGKARPDIFGRLVFADVSPPSGEKRHGDEGGGHDHPERDPQRAYDDPHGGCPAERPRPDGVDDGHRLDPIATSDRGHDGDAIGLSRFARGAAPSVGFPHMMPGATMRRGHA